MLNTSAECSYAFEGDFGTFLSSKYAVMRGVIHFTVRLYTPNEAEIDC